MRHLICFLLLLQLFTGLETSQAQLSIPLNEKSYRDSLERQLTAVRSDSERARVYFYLADFWSAKDSLRSAELLSQGQRYIQGNPFLEALYNFYLAGLIFDKDDARSRGLYLKADSALSQLSDPKVNEYRALIWNNIAILDQYQDRQEDYMNRLLNDALPLAKKSQDSGVLATIYSHIALMFTNLRELEKADSYSSMAIRTIAPVLDADRRTVNIYLVALKNKLLLGDYPAASKLMDRVYTMLRPYPGSLDFAYYYELSAMYYADVGQYDKALSDLDKGIKLTTEYHEYNQELSLQFQKYRVLAFQKSYREALEVLFYILGNRQLNLVGNRSILFNEVAGIYEALGDYKASVEWLKKTRDLKDSIHDANINNNINELEAKYKAAQKESQILALQARQSETALTLQQQKSTTRLLATGCICLVLLVGGFLWYHKRISRQKEINHAQQLREVNQRHQLSVTRALLEGEDRERKRVARDLHDGLGGMLAGVKLHLSGIEPEISGPEGLAPAVLEVKLDGVIAQLDGSITELRRIAHNMMPEGLVKLGLEKALRDFCGLYSTEQLSIAFQAMDIHTDIPTGNQVNIYRIVQELVTNAIRHAQATHIFVQCSQNGALFLITVEDNGQGMEADYLEQHKGLGWSNINNRVAFLNGRLDIQSQKGKGTVINIEVDSYAK